MKTRLLIGTLLLIAAAVAWWSLTVPKEPPPPVRPYAHSPHANAIDAGLAFLLRHEEHSLPSWQVYALLDYLQRRFGLDDRYTINRAFPRNLWPDYDQPMADLFGRLLHPKYRISKTALEEGEHWITRFMLRALYCDLFPADQAFLEELLEKYQEDLARPAMGYGATHVILCAQWLRERGCDAALPDLESYWESFADTLVAIVIQEQARTDLAFEAMAFLYYIGYGERVRPEWLQSIRDLQRLNGAWAYNPQDPDHGHPTVLALWVLLEDALPDAPRPPWIR